MRGVTQVQGCLVVAPLRLLLLLLLLPPHSYEFSFSVFEEFNGQKCRPATYFETSLISYFTNQMITRQFKIFTITFSSLFFLLLSTKPRRPTLPPVPRQLDEAGDHALDGPLLPHHDRRHRTAVRRSPGRPRGHGQDGDREGLEQSRGDPLRGQLQPQTIFFYKKRELYTKRRKIERERKKRKKEGNKE